MVSLFYLEGRRRMLLGEIDLLTDDLRIALLMTGTTAGTEPETTRLGDFSDLKELDGVGYSANDASAYSFASRTVATDGTSDFTVLDAADFVFGGLGPGSSPITQVLVYKQATPGGDFVDGIPLFLLDSTQFPATPTGADFHLSWHAINGIWSFFSQDQSIPTLPLFSFPDQTTTGSRIDEGSLAVYAGATTISTPGTTLSGFKFTDAITILASDVTIEDCLFETPGVPYSLIVPTAVLSNLSVSYCEFRLSEEAAIQAADGTFSYLDIHDTGNKGVVVTFPSTTVEFIACYLHRLGNETYTASIPGITAYGFELLSDAGGTLAITDCYIDMPQPGGPNDQSVLHGVGPYHSDACVVAQSTTGTITGNVTLRANKLRGGDYTVRLEDDGNGAVANWTLRDNVWGNEWLTAPLNFDGPVKYILGNTRDDTSVNVDSILQSEGTW